MEWVVQEFLCIVTATLILKAIGSKLTAELDKSSLEAEMVLLLFTNLL